MKSACLLAAVFVFASTHIGRADVLFNNLGAIPCCEGPIASGTPYGDSFSTGALAFDFNSLTVSLFADVGVPPSGLVITALLLADSSTNPGPVLETIGALDEDTLPAGEHVEHTFNTSSYMLAPNTRYWIELTSNDMLGSSAWVEWDSSADLSGTTGTFGEYWSANEGASTLVFADGTNGGPLLMNVSSVPEPASLMTFGMALAGLGVLRGLKRTCRRTTLARANT
jgi:PEP-CTERM motif-containing protein